MSDQVQVVELVYETNTASVEKSKKATASLIAPVTQLEKAIAKLEKAEKSEAQSVKALTSQLGKLSDEGKQNVKVANDRLQVLKKQEAAINDIADAERELIRVLDEETRKQQEAAQAAPRAARGGEDTTRALGGAAGGLGAAGTLAGTLGAGPLQEILTGLDDILTVAERAPEFVQSVSTITGSLTQISTVGNTAATATTALATAEAAEATAATAAAPATAGLAVGIGALVTTLGPIALVVAAAAAGFALLSSAIEEADQKAQVAVGAQLEYFEIIETGTSESIQAALKDLEGKRNIAQKQVEFINAQLDAMSALEQFFSREDEALEAALEDSEKQLAETTAAIDAHTQALSSEEVAANDAASAKESEAQATSSNADQAQQNAQKQQQSAQAQQEAAAAAQRRKEAADEAKRALEEAKQKEQERSRAIQQAQADIEKIEIQGAEKRADIAWQTADRLEDIAIQSARAARDARQSLEDDLDNLIKERGEQRAQTLMDAAREEEKATKDHLKAIRKISQDARLSEGRLIRRRDFAALAELREGTNRRIDEESQRFVEERKAANEALKLQLKDQAKAFQEQRAERIKAFNDQLATLRKSQREQIADLRRGQARQLRDLRISIQRQLAERRRALEIELRMAQQASAGFSSIAELLRQRLGALSGSMRGSIPGRRQSGGPLSFGQTAFVNESPNAPLETFSTGGEEVVLPGFGLFTPLQNGQVNRGQASMGDFNTTINIDGGDNRQMIRQFDRQIARMRQDFIDMIRGIPG
jgi:hypothetical protein